MSSSLEYRDRERPGLERGKENEKVGGKQAKLNESDGGESQRKEAKFY